MNFTQKLSDMGLVYKSRQSPNVPKHAIPRPKYSDSNANQLTTCVRDFLRMKGHYCGRTNTTGTYSAKIGKFIHSGATRGQSDLNAIINGRSWQIEIKHGRDHLNESQKRVKKEVESAGGVYLVVRFFREFIDEYMRLTGETIDTVFTLATDHKSVGHMQNTQHNQL